MESEKVNIELSKSEAIVLFDFLGRFNEMELNNVFEDKAEEQVLWNIECLLEKKLVEPFQSDYSDIVRKSREEIRNDGI